MAYFGRNADRSWAFTTVVSLPESDFADIKNCLTADYADFADARRQWLSNEVL